MPDASALYPQPPQAQQGILSDPSKLYGFIAAAQMAKQFAAKQALGQAYQKNLNADGTPNIPGIAADLKKNPDAGFVLPEATSNILAQHGQMIQNDTSTFEQWAKQNDYGQQMLAGLANKPELSLEDLHNAAAGLSRNADPRALPSSVINSVMQTIQNDPGGLRAGAVTMQNRVMGAANAASRQTGVPNLQGGPTTVPLGSLGYGGSQSDNVLPGQMTTGNPPGFGERQAGAAALDTKLAGGLADAAEGSPSRIGILGNLDNAVDKFTAGPGADWSMVAKAFVNRNVPLPAGWQFDPKSIASQQEFNKQAMQLAQQQFQSIGGTGTDAKFSSAFETSPNETLSTLGNKGIIRLLKGNEDALQAKNSAWLRMSEANPNASYRQFSQDFNNHFDPRVFQFKYMSPSDRKEYVQKMDPQEQQRFLYNATVARKQGWINYDMSK
jgi:hypothetical protein